MKFIERDEDYILGLYLAAYHTNTHTCLVRGARGGGGGCLMASIPCFYAPGAERSLFFLGGGGHP